MIAWTATNSPFDGTLLDSVDLHALAWHEALVKFGHDVSLERVRTQIGKGGDKLIPMFLSADEQRDHGKELEDWRGSFEGYVFLEPAFPAHPNFSQSRAEVSLPRWTVR